MSRELKYYIVYFYASGFDAHKEGHILMARSKAGCKRVVLEAWPHACGISIKQMESEV